MSSRTNEGTVGSAAAPVAATDAEAALSGAAVTLVYDGDCPACSNYVRTMRVRDAVGDFRLVDAREDTDVMREITAAGLDMDEGMVLKIGDRLYHGSDALHAFALLGSRSGVFNRLNYWMFRSPALARTAYPAMKAGRALLLRLLRKRKLNNLGVEGNERF